MQSPEDRPPGVARAMQIRLRMLPSESPLSYVIAFPATARVPEIDPTERTRAGHLK